ILAEGESASALSMDHYRALAERLLIGDHSDDLKPVAQREPVASLLAGSMMRLREMGIDPMQADIEAHYRWIDHVTERALRRSANASFASEHSAQREHGQAAPAAPEAPALDYAPATTWTERLDAVLIHKVWGLLIFAGIMGALFYSLF